MTPVAQPAAPSTSVLLPYAPDAWFDAPAPVTEGATTRSLGRVRMPVRALFLVTLLLTTTGGSYALLLYTDVYVALGWEWYYVIAIASGHLIGLIFLVVTPRWILRRHNASELVAWRRPIRQDLVWVAGGLALMVGLWLAYWQIIPWTGWEWALPVQHPEDADVVVFISWWHLVLFACSAVIVAPYVEETFFRGFMLGGLNRVWWLLPSILLSAVLFSAVHLNLRVIIPFAISGAILGVLYLRTKHLTAPALAHAGWNLGVTVLLVLDYGVG